MHRSYRHSLLDRSTRAENLSPLSILILSPLIQYFLSPLSNTFIVTIKIYRHSFNIFYRHCQVIYRHSLELSPLVVILSPLYQIVATIIAVAFLKQIVFHISLSIVWPVSRPQINCFLFERELDRKELAASCDCRSTCKSPNTAAHLLSKCE